MQEITMIRPATAGDAAVLANIYAYYVRETAVSFECDAPTADEFAARIKAIQKRYPWLVAEQGGALLGYVYASALNTREAYSHSAELSIYIDRTKRGLHIGSSLLHAIEPLLAAQGVTNLYACVAYAEQEDAYLTQASVHFHHAMGFQTVGHLHGCGKKFGRLYDILWLEKFLPTLFEENASKDCKTQGDHKL